MRACLHFIGGEEAASRSGRTFPSLNPATGEEIASVAFGETEDVDRAVEAAWKAYHDGLWSRLAPSERARRLRRTASLVRDHADEIADTETLDSGKPRAAAGADVAGAAELLDYFSTIPENMSGTVYADSAGYFTHSRREPYGVVAAIAPWNFPFMNAVWKTGAALAVGNSVILKMAEQTPLTTSMYARLAAEAGVPAGVLNVVHGDGPTTGAALVQHPRVPKITFTGSTEVGRAILQAAAREIKSVHLELGGKSPNIVFADADLDQARSGSLFTGFFNSGQICTAGARLLVAAEVADEFLASLTEAVEQLRSGDPFDERTQLGPLVSAEQQARVRHYVKSGREAGATVAYAAEEHVGAGYYTEPTIFDRVAETMSIAQEEIFGPVLTVMRFETEDEAIALANNVAYGLAATVWTNTLDRALRLMDRVEAGIVWVNCPHHLAWNAPYEGHKHSGLGEDLGLEAIRTFTKLKVAYINYRGDRLRWE